MGYGLMVINFRGCRQACFEMLQMGGEGRRSASNLPRSLIAARENGEGQLTSAVFCIVRMPYLGAAWILSVDTVIQS